MNYGNDNFHMANNIGAKKVLLAFQLNVFDLVYCMKLLDKFTSTSRISSYQRLQYAIICNQT